MSLFEAHGIESQVVESIRAMPEVDDVFVHVVPKELGEWKPDDDDADGLVGTTAAGAGNDPSERDGRTDPSDPTGPDTAGQRG